MKQIVNIGVGQAGIQICESLIQLYLAQHSLTNQGRHVQLKQINENYKGQIQGLRNQQIVSSIFRQTNNGHFQPRFMLLDTQPDAIDNLKKSDLSHILNPTFMLHGKQSSAGNYARAYYVTHSDNIQNQNYEDQIKKFVQPCDSLQAFTLTHALAGGTGSGMTARLMDKLSDAFPKVQKTNFALLHNKNSSTQIVGVYNSAFALSNLILNSNLVIAADNHSLYNIVSTKMDIQEANYSNINYLMAQVHSAYTLSSRFNSNAVNCSIKDIQTNLVSYPRINFAIPSLAPLNSLTDYHLDHEQFTEEKLLKDCFDGTNQLIHNKNCANEYRKNDYHVISSVLLGRGHINEQKFIRQANKVRQQTKWVDFCPTGLKIGINSQCARKFHSNQKNIKLPSSVTSLTSSIQFHDIFVGDDFDKLYAKRAFVHWFAGIGIDSGQFQQSRQNIAALQKDYQYWQINDQYQQEYQFQ